MADGRHIEKSFFLYLGAILADQRDEFGIEMKDHMPI